MMNQVQLFLFEDSICKSDGIDVANSFIKGKLKSEVGDVRWHDQFDWHERWRNGTAIESSAAFAEALEFCRTTDSSGIACFDFKLNNVNVTDEQISLVAGNGVDRQLADNFRDKPGLLLAWAMATNPKAKMYVLFSTQYANVRATFEEPLRVASVHGRLGNLHGSVSQLASDESLGEELWIWIKAFIEDCDPPPPPPPPPPEQAITDFFNWRRTDPTATTTELHKLNDCDFPKFKKHSAYKALGSLLRLTQTELDNMLSTDGCQRAFLEALKGMGGDNDDATSQQCSILGLFLIAWSAIRERKIDDDRFLEQFSSYSKTYRVARKKVDKSNPVTQGFNSLSAVLSAFFLFHELATDDVGFTNDQLAQVHLDESGFRIEFNLKQKGNEPLERFEYLRERVEKAFTGMQTNFERKASPVVGLDRQPRTSVVGSLTSKALIHLMMEVGCRQSLFGGDQRAEMSVQWKNSDGILVIKFAPRVV